MCKKDLGLQKTVVAGRKNNSPDCPITTVFTLLYAYVNKPSWRLRLVFTKADRHHASFPLFLFCGYSESGHKAKSWSFGQLGQRFKKMNCSKMYCFFRQKSPDITDNPAHCPCFSTANYLNPSHGNPITWPQPHLSTTAISARQHLPRPHYTHCPIGSASDVLFLSGIKGKIQSCLSKSLIL